jgi:hypothetical protein
MPPPPPPPPAAEEQIHICRDGVVLGVWPASAIRPMIVSGDLRPTDHFWVEGAADWQRLIPDSPTKVIPYPYVGDDVPIYFIRDGLLFGPRQPRRSTPWEILAGSLRTRWGPFLEQAVVDTWRVA